jgi:hypothetical protein
MLSICNAILKLIIKIMKISVATLILNLEMGHIKLSLAAFRSAIIQKVGFIESDLFHNHFTNNDVNVHYRYPMVQYKWIEGKPAIICLGEAIHALLLFFEKSDNTLNLYQNEIPFEVHTLSIKEHELSVSETLEYTYKISDYAALNSQNFAAYMQLQDEDKRFQMLEKLLVNHLAAFANGNGYKPEKRFEVKIIALKPARVIESNEHKLKVFDFSFNANLKLPNYVGVGKDTAKGLGIITRIV